MAGLGGRFLRGEGWRMPVDVRKGMVVCQGWYLKLATLLVELECAAAFLYVDITLYLGHTPLDVVMVIWLVALLASVWLPCRRAGKIGRGELAWKGEQPEQNQGQACIPGHTHGNTGRVWPGENGAPPECARWREPSPGRCCPLA